MLHPSIGLTLISSCLVAGAPARGPQGGAGSSQEPPGASPGAHEADAQAAAPFEVVNELDKAIWRIYQDSRGTHAARLPAIGLFVGMVCVRSPGRAT